MASINNDIRARRSNRSMPVIAAVALFSLLLSLFASLMPYNVSAAANLFSDGFEGSYTAWTSDTPENGKWEIDNSGHTGKAARVKGGNTPSKYLYKDITTTGYENIVLSYWYKADNLEDSSWWPWHDDIVRIQYSTNNGSSWSTLFTISDSNDDDSWHSKSHTLPAAAENLSTLKIRVYVDFDNGNDNVWIDDVSVVADQMNQAPVASDGSATTDEDTAITITLLATDADSNPLTYSIVTNPANGTLGAVSGNQVTYTPDPDYNGSDSFTVKANDGTANSNTATISLTVDPVNDLPTLTLNGATPVTVAFGGTYSDLGATADDVEDGSNIAVTTTDTVDTNTVGSYTLTYNFTDSDGAVAALVTRTVNVVDQGTPVVTITPGTQTIEATGPTGAAASYTVSATDDVDGDISASAICDIASGSIFALGVTTITCSATDSAGNTGSNTATVTVLDTTAPVITLNGNATITVIVGGTYTETGAEALDIVDGSTAAAVGGDVVDANTIGTYTVTYNATDAAGNDATPVTRTVEVVAQPVEDTQALCTDGIDNDSDGQTDLTDTDCAAFVPPPTPPSNGGGGGGGGGAPVSGPFSIGFVNTNPTSGGAVLGAATGVVLGTSTEALPNGCSAYLTSYLKKGSANSSEVKKLQSFLNEEMGAELPVTGFFGPLTFNAVSAFQTKYAAEVLKPWFDQKLSSDMNPSGYVYKMTLYKINLIKCASLNTPLPQLP